MVAGHQVAFFLREFGSAEAARRAAAVKGLSRVRGYGGELAALAADAAADVRAAVALGLGRQGDSGAVGVLVGLCSDPDAEVRRRAVNALDRIGASGSEVEAAFGRLVGDGQLRSRPVVLFWLVRHEVAVPETALVPLLAEPDPMIWSPTCSLLRLLPEADAVFADLVRSGTGEVRQRALWMLAHPQAGIPGLGPGVAPRVREAAWRRLWDPSQRVVTALLSALEAETEPIARTVLFRALAAHRVPGVVEAAAPWLADEECGPAAAAALAGAGTVEAIDVLRRFGTVRELGAAGGVADAEVLLGLLEDPDESVRQDAVGGLGAFFQRFDGGAHGRLERWRAGRVPAQPVPPSEDDPVVRGLARRAAERLTQMLTRDVEHADAYHNALWSIPEVRALLPELLEHPEGKVRSTALHLAERFGEMDFDGRLRFLDDQDARVRQRAALTFAMLAQEHGLSPAERRTLRQRLERGKDDPDYYVRTWAAKALDHLD